MRDISSDELTRLIVSVFPPRQDDTGLAVLIDVPGTSSDKNAWKDRREMAISWVAKLRRQAKRLQLERIDLIAYKDIGSNNADLPPTAWVFDNSISGDADVRMLTGKNRDFSSVFSEYQLFLAPTEFSATAPLKLAARKYGFRAATMPGFSSDMIPALRIDYEKVNHLVVQLKKILDPAISAEAVFAVDDTVHTLRFDLRYRTATASGGRFPDAGTAGNLPGGETYIVPYEGGCDEPSETRGILPVQIEDEIVLYSIEENRARKVVSSGPVSDRESEILAREPAYGNMAELGFGVLGDFGLEPIGEILLDEKLGFHIAFGRSDHFGGIVGPKQFSNPRSVVHLDRIYIKQTQPRVRVNSISLDFGHGKKQVLMRDGRYVMENA